jgi:hypothetical protein
MEWLLPVHAGATLIMVGIIWFAQIVHYPLMDGVGREGFAEYERRNTLRTGWVVSPPMLTEGLTAIALLGWRPPGISEAQVWSGVGLLLVIWASTFLLQVPRHKALLRGFDPRAHRALVRSNWIRTAAWSLRGGLALWMSRAWLGT